MIEAGVEFLMIAAGGTAIALACGAAGVIGGELKDAVLRALHRR